MLIKVFIYFSSFAYIEISESDYVNHAQFSNRKKALPPQVKIRSDKANFQIESE